MKPIYTEYDSAIHIESSIKSNNSFAIYVKGNIDASYYRDAIHVEGKINGFENAIYVKGNVIGGLSGILVDGDVSTTATAYGYQDYCNETYFNNDTCTYYISDKTYYYIPAAITVKKINTSDMSYGISVWETITSSHTSFIVHNRENKTPSIESKYMDNIVINGNMNSAY